MKKPRILLDCDCVLSDYVSPALAYLASQGVNKSYDEVTSWDIFRDHKSLEPGFNVLASTPGFCYALDVLPGADDFVGRAHLEYEVMVVTAAFSTPTWCSERTRWLSDKLGISKHAVAFVYRKEVVVGDVLVDDKADNVVAWAESHPGKLAILYDQPWNQHENSPKIVRASGFRGVCDALASHGLPRVFKKSPT